MKKAIYTIMIGDHPMFRYTRYSMEKYAQRVNADLIVRTQRLLDVLGDKGNLSITTACAEKIFIDDLLNTYDRVLYLDGDVLIAPDSPNIFDVYPDTKKFYGFHEAEYEDRAFCVNSICNQLNYKGSWEKKDGRYLYYNGGVILCSRESNFLKHKSITEFRNLYKKIPHHDQTYFSYLIQRYNIPNQPIDYRFDRMDYMKQSDPRFSFEQRFEAYFIHYAGAGYTVHPNKKQETVAKDFEKLYGAEAKAQLDLTQSTKTTEIQKNPILTSNFNTLKKARYGFMLYNDNDIYVGGSIKSYGEFSEGEVNIFRQVVRRNDVVLDIGANIGAHTLFFSQAVEQKGVVLAFEPQRIVFQTLCANMALNSVTNVHCYHTALGESAGEITVPFVDYGKQGNFGGLSMENQKSGERVKVNTIDSFQLTRCNFIKIDVEGMERAVLAGAVETIKRHKPILYVENDRENKSAELISYIHSLGYRMFWHLPPLFNSKNFYENSHNIFGKNVLSINMLCIHKDIPINLQGFREVTGPEDSWQKR